MAPIGCSGRPRTTRAHWTRLVLPDPSVSNGQLANPRVRVVGTRRRLSERDLWQRPRRFRDHGGKALACVGVADRATADSLLTVDEAREIAAAIGKRPELLRAID